MSEYRQNAMCAYWSGKIYVIGGYHDDTYQSSMEMLDIETNCWRFLSPLPAPRHHAGATVING